MHHQLRQALTNLTKGDDLAVRAAHYLRTSVDYADQVDALGELPHHAPSIERFLLGKCFASDWNEVWFSHNLPSITNSQKAINWLIATFTHHKEAIQKHTELSSSLRRALLLGIWPEARTLLNLHHQALGPTLWGMHWLFVLAEENGGQQVRLEILDKLRGVGTPNISAFSSLFSLAADRTLPEEHYRAAIRKCIPNDDRSFRQFLEVLLIEDHSDKWEAWEMIKHVEVLPLIDRYEFFLRIAAIVLAAQNEDSIKFIRALQNLTPAVDDFQLHYMANSMTEPTPIRPISETKDLLNAWDAYMDSQYEASLQFAEEVSLRRPELLPAHELVIKSAMYLGRMQQFETTATPVMLLRHHLYNVLSKNEQSEDSLSYLNRLSSRFRIFSMTAPLRALHTQHASPNPDDKWHRRAACTIGVHGPRNFEYGHSLNVNQSYLTRCTAAFPQSTALRFFAALGNSADGTLSEISSQGVAPIRRHFFAGLALARRRQRPAAIGALTEFLNLQGSDSANPLSPFATEEARRVLVDQYRLGGNVRQMQCVAVKLYLDRSQSVRRLPMRQIYELCLENVQEASRSFEFPIIAYLACDDPHEVCLALRRYMRCVGVTHPQHLSTNFGLEVRSLAILFLRVCTAEVLDSIEALDSVEKVEAERLHLLRWIIKHTPHLGRIAETEVLRLTQQAQLRDALQKLEGARVVLNVAALRETEQERFSDAFFRYSAQRDLVDSKAVDEVQTAIAAIRRGESGPFLVTRQDKVAFDAFASAFREIRDAFVSSPHFGIEACLSSRIRHGVVIQHIRKPLVERKLAVTKDSPERDAIEAYWCSKLSCEKDVQLLRLIIDILATLTQQVNTIAEEVKSVWIQSKTETRNPGGLFDYAFDDAKLKNSYYRQLGPLTSLETYLDRVFDILLERTRRSLRNVQERIDRELRGRLGQAIDGAIAALAQVPDEGATLPLRNELAACRQDTERNCEQMKRWFQGADATLMIDASFDLIARTAIGMVERLNPEFRGCHPVNITAVERIRGRYFTAFVHILFFLLENAIKHRDVHSGAFRSTVLVATEPGTLTITVQSNLSSEASAAAAALRIRSKIVELKKDLDSARVIREGGTGFAKIIAAIRYEFKQQDPTIGAGYNTNLLNVTVSCGLEGLTA